MRLRIILVSAVLLTGCTSIPYKELNIDSTTNFKFPKTGQAGIYVYQWKTGIYGALTDVECKIKGFPGLSLNTGEYGYYEIPPGDYEYRFTGGLIHQYEPVTFEANQNYFFRAALAYFSYFCLLITDQSKIDNAKKNILSGHYEEHTVD
jgi:hypothetical protein